MSTISRKVLIACTLLTLTKVFATCTHDFNENVRVLWEYLVYICYLQAFIHRYHFLGYTDCSNITKSHIIDKSVKLSTSNKYLSNTSNMKWANLIR